MDTDKGSQEQGQFGSVQNYENQEQQQKNIVVYQDEQNQVNSYGRLVYGKNYLSDVNMDYENQYYKQVNEQSQSQANSPLAKHSAQNNNHAQQHIQLSYQNRQSSELSDNHAQNSQHSSTHQNNQIVQMNELNQNNQPQLKQQTANNQHNRTLHINPTQNIQINQAMQINQNYQASQLNKMSPNSKQNITFTNTPVFTANARQIKPSSFYVPIQRVLVQNRRERKMDRLYSPSLSPPNQNIKKSVSPPMLMSFAPTHPNFKPIEITNPLVHLNRSRVISQKQGPPLKHLPDYLRNRQLKQEVTIKPYSVVHNRTQHYPVTSVLLQQAPRSKQKIINFRPSSLYDPNIRLNQPLHNSQTNQVSSLLRGKVASPLLINTQRHSPPKVTINNHIATSIHSVTTDRVRPSQIPMIPGVPIVPLVPLTSSLNPGSPSLKQWRESDQGSGYVNQITVIYGQFHYIIQSIQTILNKELDVSKQRIIIRLLSKVKQLQQKLLGAQKNWDNLSKQNRALRQKQKQTNFGSVPIPTQSTTAPFQKHQIQNKQIAQLKTKVQRLQKQNQSISERYRSLQEQSVINRRQNNQQQLLQTIENQKSMIKKLEQELMQATTVKYDSQILRTNSQFENINIESSSHNNSNANINANTNITVTANNNITINNDNSEMLMSFKPKKTENVDESAISQNQSKYLTIIESKEAYINELQAEIIRYKTQIKNLKKQLLKQRNQKTASTISGDENSFNSSIQRFKNFQGSTEKLGNIIIQKQQEVNGLKKKIFDIQDQYDIIMEQKQTRIRQLLQQISKIEQSNLIPNSNANNYKTNKENEYEEYIQKLQALVKEKDGQIMQLALQNSKASQKLEYEINTLNGSIRMKNEEQMKLRQTVTQLQNNIRELNLNEGKAVQAKKMIEALRNKQNEVAQLNKTVQKHLKDIKQLQNQINQLQQNFKFIQQGILQQRRVALQRENELIQKINNLESNKRNEQNLVNQLKQTVSQLTVRVNESQKLKQAQKQKSKQSSELQSSRNVSNNNTVGPSNIRVISASKNNVVQSNDIAVGQNEQDFRLQYSRSQVKIFELQAALKQRQSQIKQLQINIESMKVKNNSSMNSSHDITAQQLNILRKKLAEYESRFIGQLGLYNQKQHHINQIFEKRIIYQLKAENEKLRKMLGQQPGANYHLSYDYSFSGQNRRNSKSDKSYILAIQTRLQEFNTKIQQIIQSNRIMEHQGNTQYKNYSSMNSQIFGLFERQKSVIIKKHHRQIQSLQNRLHQLQKYCTSLENYHDTAVFNSLNTQIKLQDQTAYTSNDQLLFYKSKNKELEERVDLLLQLNRQLKNKVELNPKTQGEGSIQYYRQQIRLMQNRIQQYEEKHKKWLQQKNELMKEIESGRQNRVNQQTMRNLEHKIRQLTSVNTHLEQNNIFMQKQIKKLRQQRAVSLMDKNSGTLGKQNETKAFEYENNIRMYISKMGNYQNQISILRNQNQILKSQIQRIQQLISYRKNEDKAELNECKRQIEQHKKQIKSMSLILQQKQRQKHNYVQSITELRQKISLLQINNRKQLERLTNSGARSLQIRIDQLQFSLNQQKRSNRNLEEIIRQKEQQIRSLDAAIAQLQKQASIVQSQVYQSSVKTVSLNMQYYLQKIRSIFILIQSLTQQIVEQQQQTQCKIIQTINLQICNGLAIIQEVCQSL